MRMMPTMKSVWILALCSFFSAAPAWAEIRGCMDGKGYFRFPGVGQPRPGKAARPVSGIYDQAIREASGMYSVESGLVKAVIKAESGFNPVAVSSKGALGLMQLMPSTASLMEVADPFDPTENVNGGTRYLSILLKRFKGDRVLALAAYNAGPEKVDFYQGLPPYPETVAYVRKVMQYYRAYSGD